MVPEEDPIRAVRVDGERREQTRRHDTQTPADAMDAYHVQRIISPHFAFSTMAQ